MAIEKKLDHTIKPDGLRNLTKFLLIKNETQIQTIKGTSSSKEIKKGFFQGLPLPPKIFNLSINHVLGAVNEPNISSRYGFQISHDVDNVSGRGLAFNGNSKESVCQLANIGWNE